MIHSSYNEIMRHVGDISDLGIFYVLETMLNDVWEGRVPGAGSSSLTWYRSVISAKNRTQYPV